MKLFVGSALFCWTLLQSGIWCATHMAATNWWGNYVRDCLLTCQGKCWRPYHFFQSCRSMTSQKPLFGCRCVTFRKESFHWFPGPQHHSKNLAEQARGSIRTIMIYGRFVDFAAGLQCGLWPAAFIGHDTMSDWQAALMLLGLKLSWFYMVVFPLNITQLRYTAHFHPLALQNFCFNLLSSFSIWFLRWSPMHFAVDPLADVIKIPWLLQGAFLLSLVGAHIHAATLHACDCREWRLEVAMTGHLPLRELSGFKPIFEQFHNTSFPDRCLMHPPPCNSWKKWFSIKT